MNQNQIFVLLIASFLAISALGMGLAVLDSTSEAADGETGDEYSGIEDGDDGIEEETDVEKETDIEEIPFAIEVFKYYGEEGHDDYEYGEGLEGWTFELYQKGSPWELLDTGVTDEDGYLIFDLHYYVTPHEEVEASPWDYHFKVREILEDGWYFTGGFVSGGSAGDGEYFYEELEQSVQMNYGQVVNYEFGNALIEECHDITVFSYYDVEGDGEYDEDAGDYGLYDVHIELYMSIDGVWIFQEDGYTDSDGYLYFECMQIDGNYQVRQYVPEGWYNTEARAFPTPTGELTGQDLETEIGDIYVDVSFFLDVPKTARFGNREYEFEDGSIEIYKFHDVNYDGYYDEDHDYLMDGFEFQLWTADEDGNPEIPISDVVETYEGMYTFEDLDPGYYVVLELIPEVEEGEYCWLSTTGTFVDDLGTLISVEVEEGETSEAWFGNVRGGGIEGMKFLSIEGDEEFEVGLDKPLMGWNINLWNVEDGEPGEIIDSTVTDRSGEYYFDCVFPGEYYVQEEMPEGWYNVTAAVQYMYVEPSETVDGVDFANCMYKDIYGIKFYDYTMDGEFTEDDWVLEGWQINLWNEIDGEPGEIIDTAYTQSNGYYFFDDLTVGTYYVEEVIPEGWTNTTPSIVQVEFNCCTPCYPVNFGNYELPEITIIKFNDPNFDGYYDPEIHELVDSIVMFDIEGSAFEGDEGFYFETLSVTGKWSFYVDVGYWVVTEQLPEGWVNTTPLIQNYTLGPGDHWQVEFGNVQYGDIEVFKFHDLNMDGEYNEEEYGLEGWTFNLWNTTMDNDFPIPVEIIETNVTDEDGFAMFWDLGPGHYAIEEIGQTGWHATTDTLQFVEIIPGETVTVEFGNVEYGNIEVFKFHDLNMDGEYDEEDEYGLGGWTFNLWNTTMDNDVPTPVEVIETNVTDEDGYVYFEHLLPGLYAVEEEEQDCWFPTTDTVQFIEIGPGETGELHFGNVEGAWIYGYKYCDYNLNQEFDDHEYGLEGWTINLWAYEENEHGETPMDHHEPYMSTVTDEDGYYEFTCVMPGMYTVEEVMQEGWYNSTPYYYEVELLPGEGVRYDFGNYRYGDITGIKFFDFTMNGTFEPKEGDIPLRGREVQLWASDEDGNPIDDEPIYTTETDEHGMYIFEDVGPGDYVVYQPKPCCDWIHTTPREVHVRMGCVEEEIVNFGEYKYSSIDVYVICGWEGIEVMIYESDEYGEWHELLESGYTGEHGWYISEQLAPGYYIVELEDGQYEHVQLRMGEQVEFEYNNEIPEGRIFAEAIYAKIE